MDSSKPACKNLVLDAGPLLSLSPLRGLAGRYLTVPQVLSELKDKNAREHFERLGLSAGVKIEVKEADAVSLAQVIQTAKKTGDYSVLSHADLCVLALTLALDTQEKAEAAKTVTDDAGKDDLSEIEAKSLQQNSELNVHASETARDESSSNPIEDHTTTSDVNPEPERLGSSDVSRVSDGEGERGHPYSDIEEETGDEVEREPLDVTLESLEDSSALAQKNGTAQPSGNGAQQNYPLFEDPTDDDDGEGEWITPTNISLYKSRALDWLPSVDSSSDPFTTVSSKKVRHKNSRRGQTDIATESRAQIPVGCMTADFAMQNVLLQMGLSLVGLEGKRIEKVNTWVLRCHACFKICKDSTKKFCPSCGNPSLLRASVTAKAPTADDSTPALEVHLKKNFVYKTRGTIYSIPAPKPGSSKTGSGEGLILREDQTEYMRATKRLDGKREREEKRMVHNALQASKTTDSTGVKIGSWMDPDWVPEMLSVGTGGKGRRAPDSRGSIGTDGMPIIGHGRKNPNEKRRKK